MALDVVRVTRGWRRLFLLEVPICAATVAYWVLAPAHFARALGAEPDAGTILLVVQLAGVVGSLLVWTYGRWLASGEVELRPFRFLQEGLLLGDVFLVLEGAWALRVAGADPAVALAQIAAAAAWGVVRVGFLATTRVGRPA